MAIYNLKTAEDIRNAVNLAREDAWKEHNQSSYNAAWKHGYADALAEVVKQQENQPSGRFISEEVLQKIKHLLDHAANGATEYAYLLDDTWRITRFVEELDKLLQPFPDTMIVPGAVANYFRWKYASVVKDLNKTEKDHQANPKDDVAKDFYIEAGAQEQLLNNLCNDFNISLYDDDMNPIPFEEVTAENAISYADMPVGMISHIRAEHKSIIEAVREAEEECNIGEEIEETAEENLFFAQCQQSYLREFCDEIGLELVGNDGDLIPAD